MKKQYSTQQALGGQQQEQQQQGQQSPIDSLRAEANGEQDKMSPELKAELQNYKTLLTKLIHSKEKRDSTLDMLKAGPAMISVPNAALTLNRQAEEIMNQNGIQVSINTKLAGSVYLVSDLIELGNVAAEWDTQVGEQEAKEIYQDTLQDYIDKGLKDKTIDPLDLQQRAEPLMNEQQRALGTQFAKQQGIPLEPSNQQIVGNQRSMLQSGGTQ